MQLRLSSLSVAWFLLLIIVAFHFLDPVHAIPFELPNGTAAVFSSSSNSLVEHITTYALARIAASVPHFKTYTIVAQPLPSGPGGMTALDFQHLTVTAYDLSSQLCLITANTFNSIFTFGAPIYVPTPPASIYAPFDWSEQHAATRGHAMSVNDALERLQDVGQVGPWVVVMLAWPIRDPVDGGNGREMWIMLKKIVIGREIWCMVGSSSGRTLYRSRDHLDGGFDELGGVEKFSVNMNGTNIKAEAPQATTW